MLSDSSILHDVPALHSFFLLLDSNLVYTDAAVVHNSSIAGHLSSFCLSVVVNSVAINRCIIVFVEVPISNSLIYTSR